MAKYKCFLNTDRFWYILSNLKSDSNFKISGNEIFKKTASFYGDNHNIYIDTSDGINEDFGIEEYGGRIKAVIKECNGKPFIFFKSFYSPSISSKIEKIANNNNGKVCPFFFWSVQNEYKQLYKNPNRNAQQGHSKAYDLGLFFDPTAYYYPKPNACDKDIAWPDFKHFNLGCNKNTGDYKVETRKDILERFKSSDLNIDFANKMNYHEYVKRSANCKFCFCPPGVGEYTQRMFDYGLLNIPILMRKTTYDFAISWKDYIPEIDFKNNNWEREVEDLIRNVNEYKKLQKEYFNNILSPQNIFSFFKKSLLYNI